MPSYCRPQLEQTSQPGLLDRLCGLSEGHPVHLGAPQLGEGVTLPQLTYDGGRVGVQSDVVDVEQPGRGQSVGVDGDPTRFLGRRGLDCRQDVTSLLPWPYSAAPSAAAQWSEASRWSSANGESSPGEGSRPKSATGRLLPPRPSTGTTISRSPFFWASLNAAFLGSGRACGCTDALPSAISTRLRTPGRGAVEVREEQSFSDGGPGRGPEAQPPASSTAITASAVVAVRPLGSPVLGLV